ncbi:hypothetical protein SAMN05428642_1201 [Flaviramulus basaltis]|uniref:SprT-like family protein n=1 Tax=Flaviramulus basaltis TaxID=369401 RepID=A0A1K2IS37_9FLAO|nr:hypothetical protein [Flaviramulus basaltis]SFZ95253.1 hypothetical protein SAMN05428642_1201 [Flaviramulus basaltis]
MKQKLKNYFKIGTLFFGIVLLFTNCEQQVINEELKNQTNSYETELTALAKDWFNQSKNNLLILNYTKTIDWEHAIVSNGNNGDIIEIPLILNNDYSVKYNKDTSITSFYRLIFVKDQTNQYELYTLIISTDDNSFDNNSNKFNYYNLQDNFNGFTVILNSKNELDAFNKYQNGEKLTHPKNNSLFAKEPVFCTYFGYYICDTNNACVFEPLWLVGCSQGGGETAPNSGYHSTGGGTGGGSVKITNGLTNPCANNIFDELNIEMIKKDLLNKFMTTPNGVQLTFAESILKLFNDSDKYNYTIKNETLNSNTAASTVTTTTTLNNMYLKNATQLSISRTIIHEMVHAFLNIKYKDPFYSGFDFRQKMELYAEESGCDINDVERFHHEFMGQYVDAIAISLYNWDTKYGTGGNLGWDYYKAMAFGGLFFEENGTIQETYSFQVLIPNQTDRDKIKNILKNEQDGNSNSKGKKCD